MSTATFGGWDRQGNVNAALYAPGDPCDAFPGSPTFANVWAVVYWYPGRDEEIKVHESHGAAIKSITERLQIQAR